MHCKQAKPLSAFDLVAEPLQLTEPGSGGAPYQVFRLRMTVDGKQLTKLGMSTLALHGIEMWLSQWYDRSAEVLTCSCGILECAGFDEPMRTSRRGGVLTWQFPEHYFAHLKSVRLATGRPRAVSFHFEATAFNQKLEACIAAVRAFEVESGKPSGFEPGSYTAPRFRIDEQLQRALARQARTVKGRRYARHRGTPAGVCAGAQP